MSNITEHQYGLLVKRHLDQQIADREANIKSYNTKALTKGQQSRSELVSDIGKATVGGTILGAGVGAVSGGVLKSILMPFKKARHLPIGRVLAATGGTLGGLGFGTKRAKKGRKKLFPVVHDSKLERMRGTREELKNPFSPANKLFVRTPYKQKIKNLDAERSSKIL